MRLSALAVACAVGCGARSDLLSELRTLDAAAPDEGADGSDCGHAVAFAKFGDDVYLPGVNGVPATGFTWDFWFKPATLPTSSAADLSTGATLVVAADGVGCEDIYVGFGTVQTPANELAFNVDSLGECGARDTSPIHYTPSSGFVLGKWYFIAVSHDYGTGYSRLYVDGALVASKTASDTPIPRILPVTVGRWYDRAQTAYNEFDGAIDELHIYGRVLGDSEITSEYGSGSGSYGSPTDTGLVAGYHFDEGTGAAASDYAVGGAAGILESSARWEAGFVCKP